MIRGLRYLAPNLISALGLTFGLLSLVATSEGRYIDACALLMYAVFTDRFDGVVARLVKGTSEFGVQLDSLVDFLTFGICPAAIVYQSLSHQAMLPFQEGRGHLVLSLGALLWVLGATFRLARFNITEEETVGRKRIFFGIPTTLAAGLMACYFMTFAKYTPPEFGWFVGTFEEPKLFANFVTPLWVWRMFPLFLGAGGILMASSLRMPKLGLARSKSATVFIFGNLIACSVCAIFTIFPEYMVMPPTMWIFTFLVWGAVSKEAKSLNPPPIFPRVDPPSGQEPLRPEDDLVPEGSDHPLDTDDMKWGSTGELERPVTAKY